MAMKSTRGPHAGFSSWPGLWMESHTVLCLALKAQE